MCVFLSVGARKESSFRFRLRGTSQKCVEQANRAVHVEGGDAQIQTDHPSRISGTTEDIGRINRYIYFQIIANNLL